MTARLCTATLERLPAAVRRPRYDRSAIECGIVHIGPGAFHRVHQAWYAEQWLATDRRPQSRPADPPEMAMKSGSAP